MGRKPNQIVKGNHSSAIFFLYSRQDKEGKHQLKLRLTVDRKTSIEIPVIINREKIRVIKNHFNSGRVTGGYENGSLNNLNLYLARTAVNAINVGDQYCSNRKTLTPQILTTELEKLNKVLPVKNTDVVRTIQLDTNSDPNNYEPERVLNFDINKDDIENFNASYAGHTFESKEDAEEALVEINVNAKRAEIFKLPVEKIYEHPVWDRDNIFHAFGYIRYGSKIDAAGDKVPFISFAYQRFFKKLIYYRVNERPSERIEDLNEEWVHNFYRFILKGFERRLQKVVANPFVIDNSFKKLPTGNFELYNINTFGEAIHKHMVGYIKQLYLEKIIPFDFSGHIQPEAFTKQYGGNKSSYGETIYNITPKEFLTLISADINSLELDKTRDLFVSQIMMGALRVSNLTGKKIISEIDHFSTIQFKQSKTKTLITNKMLKPVKQILEKYDGVLPAMSDAEYNSNLKSLFKNLHLSRIINKKIKKLDGKGETVQQYKLYEIISSKFARSSYYVLMGAMGVSIESIAKRAGHSTTDIAMKHYYNLAQENYTEKDIINLLEHFK
jgi:hypothetical protein